MKKVLVVWGVTILFSLQGCAAVMASKQPSQKNLAVLDVGKPRSGVVAELGAPVISETKEGERKEIYTFQQGYPKWAKVSRTFWHSAADVATLGLWEVIGSPTEVYFSGQQLSYEVVFDDQDKVKHTQLIKETADTETVIPKTGS